MAGASGFDRTLNWASEHRVAKMLSLVGSGGFVYGLAVAVIHDLGHLGLDYTLPIVIPLALLAGLLVYGWIASRPKPPEPPKALPAISLVLEPGAWAIGTTGGLTCRVHVTNNAERPVKFLFARLRSIGVQGAADMFDGGVGRSQRSRSVLGQMPRVSEIEKDSTDLVACTFSENVEGIVKPLKNGSTHDDTVELVDQDGNAYPVAVTFKKV